MVIPVKDEGAASYVKKLILQAMVGKSSVYSDPKISNILKADTYYINMQTKKAFINSLNKNCNLNINPYTLNLEVILENDKKHIFVESKKSHGSNLIAHCLQAQLYYNFRNHYLQGNNSRTPGEFIREFYDPIANEIIDFLK